MVPFSTMFHSTHLISFRISLAQHAQLSFSTATSYVQVLHDQVRDDDKPRSANYLHHDTPTANFHQHHHRTNWQPTHELFKTTSMSTFLQGIHRFASLDTFVRINYQLNLSSPRHRKFTTFRRQLFLSSSRTVKNHSPELIPSRPQLTISS